MADSEESQAVHRLNLRIAELFRAIEPEDMVEVLAGSEMSLLRLAEQQQQQQQQQTRRAQLGQHEQT